MLFRSDVLAVVADASALSLTAVVDVAFAGRVAEVETQYGKALADGSSPGAIIGMAQRHVAQLHKMRLALDDGARAEEAMMRTPPPVHFSRQPLVATALRAWSAPRLVRAMQQLADAALETRRQPALAQALAQRALLALAMTARRREG